MSIFYIPEANISRLERKLKTIEKKCNKNQLSFKCEHLRDEIHETEDSETHEKVYAKFAVYEIEGSIKHDGWEFAATIDHHEKGNVIRAFKTDVAIPDKYLTCGPTCEHCNKIRSRKDTYLIYNEETKEFKQVGKNCMTEYTNGLDAETVAFWVSVYEKFEEGFGGLSGSFTRYNKTEEVIRYACECFHHFG
jgi:hypothetical protein